MKYKVIIAPMTDDEHLLRSAKDFKQAEKLVGKNNSLTLHEFDSLAEKKAFLSGYMEGIGYLGEGEYIETIVI